MPRYAFKFISGKYQGGEFPIPDEGELLIGRFSEVDLVLVEDMVSRKHAKLTAGGGEMTITDLGSTNGTFINGEKVRKAPLKLGDRVLIGTSILKVIAAEQMSAAGAANQDRGALKEMMEDLASRASPAATMSGELDEVPLPDLLQLFATNKKSGVLNIRGGERGKVFVKQGQLEYAEIEGHEDFRPMKAICRMLTWQKGTFHLDAYDEARTFSETLTESTESILIEGMRQLDEMKRMERQLPGRDSKLTWSIPMMPKLSDLRPEELDVLQLALNFETFGAVVDKHSGTDHEAMNVLTKLMQEGYLEID